MPAKSAARLSHEPIWNIIAYGSANFAQFNATFTVLLETPQFDHAVCENSAIIVLFSIFHGI